MSDPDRTPEPSVSVDDAGVVADLYRAILRRDPDAAGLGHYTEALRDGRMRVQEVAEALLFSGEAGWRLLVDSGFLATFPEMLWNSQATGDPGRRLCFLHIMKTAGTAAVAALRGAVGGGRCLTGISVDQLIVLPPILLRNVSLLAGHFPCQALQLLPEGAAVCTVLRDPVERALSHYAHLRRDELARRDDPDLTFEEFVGSPRFEPLRANYQARQLVQQIDLAGAWVDYSPLDRLAAFGPIPARLRAAPLQGLYEVTPIELGSAELEQVALERLESIDFVGVTEHLEDFVARVAHYFDVDDTPEVGIANSGGARLRAKELPPSLARRLREDNAVDYALYELASRQVTRKTRRGFLRIRS